MATAPDPADDGFYELTREEGWVLFDEEAHRCLGMSGEDFLRAWDAGEIDVDDPETHGKVMRVVMQLPLVREVYPRS